MLKKPWIGTSWKMNKTRVEARIYCATLKASPIASSDAARLFIVPPFTSIADAAQALQGTRVRVGAQNMHWAAEGAWTGEVSARMIRDVGATFVEIGHSERREFFNETDEAVGRKAAAALREGLMALICIGDTLEEFRTKRTADVLRRQVSAALLPIDKASSGEVLIAYEPVWSIGEKGVPAEPDFVEEQHVLLKQLTADIMGRPLDILYGGSVNPQNCAELASRTTIDGLFIGRAAWTAEGLIGIVESVTAKLAAA